MKKSIHKTLIAILSEINKRIDFYRGYRVNVTTNEKTSSIKFTKPKPKRVISQSQDVLNIAGHDNAIKFVEKYNRGEYTDAIHILKANRDINNETVWLNHINNYFTSFGMKEISIITGDTSRFERLKCKAKEQILDGCLVSIIMTVFNSEKTLKLSVESILTQTWKNNELIIIDDDSKDSSWEILSEIAKTDSRIQIHKNLVNVGSYVSKNIALGYVKGKYFTCHDSDDWAHPQRISKQVKKMEQDNALTSIILMIRARQTMEVTRFDRIKNSCIDGIGTFSLISCMFKTEFFRSALGNWDTVRVSGDAELFARAKIVSGKRLKYYKILGLICLDGENSLTNHPVYGINVEKKSDSPRIVYRNSYREWHKSLQPNNTFLDFPQPQRKFDAPPISLVSNEDINKNLKNSSHI